MDKINQEKAKQLWNQAVEALHRPYWIIFINSLAYRFLHYAPDDEVDWIEGELNRLREIQNQEDTRVG